MDFPAVQRVIDRAVPAAAFRLQAQLREHQHPPRLAQHRLADLEQHVRRMPKEKYSSLRNRVSRPMASPVPSSAPSSRQDIIKATATALVSRFFRRNPKIIKQWSSHVTTTHRATQAIQDNTGNRG
jgi:hypothetical protein